MQFKRSFTLGGLAATIAVAGALAFGTPTPSYAAESQPAAVVAATVKEHPRGPNRAAGRMLKVALVRATVDLTAQDVQAVRQALVDGQSLAQFAAANGSSGDAIVQAVLDKARTRLDKAVASNRITRQRADEALAKLATRATEIVNDTTLGQGKTTQP